MITRNDFSSYNFATFIRRAIQGAAVSLSLILAFIIFSAIMVKGELGLGLWILWPISFVTAAGAAGGVLFYLLEPIKNRSMFLKVSLNIFCCIAFFFMGWISLVAALAITGHWN